MFKKYCCSVFILIVAFSSSLQSQILEDRRQHSLLLQGIDLTLRQNYDSAETVFQTFIREFPQHPVGYLYLAGMLQAKYTDDGFSFNEKRYDSLLNIVEMHAKPFIRNKNTAAAGYYYTGSAEAFRSYTKSENGNLPSGIYYGLSAGGSLKRCLELDSGFVEAKNILGSFYYWRSKLAWIPFVSDRSEEGIKLIIESFDHPYEKHLASHNLMMIFIEEKRYREAEKYGQIMLNEYPDNRLFLWNMMTVYEKWDRKKELHSIVGKLLSSTLRAARINRYTEAVCRLKLAQYSIAENNVENAKIELKQLIAMKKYVGKTKGNLEKKITLAEDLLESIEKP